MEHLRIRGTIVGNTFKDNKGKGSRRPNKKERRDLEKLNGNERYGAYHLAKTDKSADFKSTYKSLKIEE